MGCQRANTPSSPELLWDFTTRYDPEAVAHFSKPLSNHDQQMITSIVKVYTHLDADVTISSSIEGNFTKPETHQSLIYVSQYDPNYPMVSGLWSFYVVMTSGNAKVISGGRGSVRDTRILLRPVPDKDTGLDDVLVYSTWFGMPDDRGSAWVLSLDNSEPVQVMTIGSVYESSCDTGLAAQNKKATVATKLFIDGPLSSISRKHYRRECGQNDFKFIDDSSSGAETILLQSFRR